MERKNGQKKEKETTSWFMSVGAVVMVVLVASAGTVQASSHAVHPGDLMEVGTSFCTINFVFDGVGDQEGDVYIGTAAHCVSHVGQSVTIGGSSGFATVAYRQNYNDQSGDFAFLLVDPQHEHRVRAEVRGHSGTPTGYTTSMETSLADVLLFSGHGTGFGMTQLTREERFGTLWSDDGALYQAHGPISLGDSGGPIVHAATGKALGIQTAIVAGCCAGPGTWIEGPTVEGMLTKAAADGFTVELRTA